MSSNNELLVSVIVLTYNQEQTVSRTLDSILAQKVDFAYEVIIGEDASPSDNTRAVCEAYAAKYPDVIRLMPKAPNKGLLRNYSDCLKACRGKYIAACAGDDWWHNDGKLQMQVSFLEQNPNYVLVYSGALIYNLVTGDKRESLPVHPSDDQFQQLVRGNFIVAATTCFRADVARAIDFDAYISRGFMMEDYPMWLEMSKIGKFHCIDECLVTYSLCPGTASNAESIEKQELFEKSVLKIIDYYTLGDKEINRRKVLARHNRSLMYLGFYYGRWWYSMRHFWKIGAWRSRDLLCFGLLITPFGICYLQKRTNR